MLTFSFNPNENPDAAGHSPHKILSSHYYRNYICFSVFYVCLLSKQVVSFFSRSTAKNIQIPPQSTENTGSLLEVNRL